MDADAQRRLGEYFDQIGDALENKTRRASFATYAMGLFSDLDRKSAEPIAARACPDPARVDALHQRLTHFLSDSDWSDRAIRRLAALRGLAAMQKREPIVAWILDDTGWLKQGKHSVGVQRQYTGSAGKTTNCQIGVSLSVATATEHLPIDFELYLPRCWTEDAARRAEARIPDEIQFRTKPELALVMVDRAIEDGIARGVVLGDTAYGNSSEFREQLRRRGLDYGLAVQSTTNVWLVDKHDRRHGDPVSVGELAARIAKRGGFRRTTWREGTKSALSARFAARRVLPSHDDGWKPTEREVVWLVMEWEDGKDAPSKYHFLTLPRSATKKTMVRTLKQRWRTERAYEDMKGELGLDHYEGRRYPGWHHHVSVVLCCYSFIVAERVSRFPPSGAWTQGDHTQRHAA